MGRKKGKRAQGKDLPNMLRSLSVCLCVLGHLVASGDTTPEPVGAEKAGTSGAGQWAPPCLFPPGGGLWQYRLEGRGLPVVRVRGHGGLTTRHWVLSTWGVMVLVGGMSL